MPVLDTNFLIALRAGDARASRLLEELAGEPLLVPSVVAVEFLTGFEGSHEEALAALGRSFTLAHTDERWMLAAALLRARLRKQRRSIRLADFWIASWAELHDTFVVTSNVADYKAMGVRARDW